MTGFTDRVSQGILNHITGKASIFALPTCYVALFTGVGVDAGTGFTEVTGGAYTRVATAATDWNAATGSAPSTINNANAIVFPTATAIWGSVIAVGLYDALSGGNLMAWDFLGNYNWLPATVSAASPAVITAKAHGFAAADSVMWSIEYGGVNPTFSASSFTGQLAVVSPTTDTFTVTNGGTAVNCSATGNGMIRKLVPTVINTGVASSFPASTINIRSA